MKKTALLLSLIVLSVIVSCSKKDSSSNPNNNSSSDPYMTATVNGKVYTYDKYNVHASEGTTFGDSAALFIDGLNSSFNDIELVFHRNTGILSSGTVYSNFMYGSSADGLLTYSDSAGNDHDSRSGQVTITSVSGKTVKGTFNFVTYDSINVTNGAFTAILP